MNTPIDAVSKVHDGEAQAETTEQTVSSGEQASATKHVRESPKPVTRRCRARSAAAHSRVFGLLVTSCSQPTAVAAGSQAASNVGPGVESTRFLHASGGTLGLAIAPNRSGAWNSVVLTISGERRQPD